MLCFRTLATVERERFRSFEGRFPATHGTRFASRSITFRTVSTNLRSNICAGRNAQNARVANTTKHATAASCASPRPRRFEGARQRPRRHVRDDDHRDEIAEDDFGRLAEHHVRIPRDIEHIVVAKDQPLRTDDPERDRRQTEEHRVVNRHPERDRHHIQRHLMRLRCDRQLHQAEHHNRHAHQRVDDVIHPKFPRRYRELCIDRQHEEKVQPARADKIGQFRDVHVEERLENLRGDLVRADKHHALPLRPVANPLGVREEDLEKHDLSTNHRNSTTIQSMKFALKFISRISELRIISQ